MREQKCSLIEKDEGNGLSSLMEIKEYQERNNVHGKPPKFAY